MKTAIIVQARMTSTRLPGKVLKEVLGKPLLAYQLERLRRVENADAIVIATTTNATDDPIVADVLSRYYGAATEHQADVVVRVTSDCPIIDPAVVSRVIGHYLAHHTQFDYVSNALQRSYPIGMDTEVFSYAALAQAHQTARHPEEREHVTPFLYRYPDRFRIAHVHYGRDESRHRWTVDTPDDFELIRRIIEALYPQNPAFTLEDTLALLERHPDWPLLNVHVQQTKLSI
jgi:spore coat polysaccharide biosynthesis protein SpsF